MPVLVTPVASDLGRRLVQRLLAEGGQVRAVARDRVAELRGAGAIVANADPDDPGRLEAAMAQVHTVILLPDVLLRRDLDSLGAEVDAVVHAARGAGVKRLVLRSLLGASPDAPDPLRAALGRMEQAVAALPLPTVVVRAGLVAEAELRAVLAGTPLPPAVRDLAVGVVDVDTLVEVLARLDAARSTATQGHAVFEAAVEPSATIGAHVESWQRDGGAAVYLDATSVPLLHDGLTGPWDRDPAALDAWEFTGVDPGRLGVDASGRAS